MRVMSGEGGVAIGCHKKREMDDIKYIISVIRKP